MSLATFPLIAWGTPDDISGGGYTTAGTLGTLTPVADPFGGTAGYTVDDQDAAAFASRFKTVTLTNDGTHAVIVFVKAGTALTSEFDLRDTTASVTRLGVSMTWSGGVPSPTAAQGSVLSPVSVGGGWYAILGFATGVVAANTNRLILYGAVTASSSTGTTLWYVRNAVLLDLLANYRRFARPREGYEAAVVPSGARDSWSYGTEYVRRGGAHWVPSVARDWPVAVSGFKGANEATGINCGVEAMLLAGLDMQQLTWVPDRSACSVNQAVYLTSPGRDWEPAEEGNGDFTFDLEMVTASAPGAVP